MLVCAELLMLSGPRGRHDAGECDVVVVLESPADAGRSTNAYRLPHPTPVRETMSSDPLYAEFLDGTKLWGIYYGTSDCILPRLFESQQQAEDAYFLEDGTGFDNLGAPDEDRVAARTTMEPVRFYTTYGSGEWRYLWNGQASRHAKIVVGPCVEPYADEWGSVDDADLTW